MSVWTGLAIYFVVWWMVIFAVLPWGVRSIGREEVSQGHAAGAPQKPRIVLKMAVTTLVAAVVWLGIYAIIESGWITFRG